MELYEADLEFDIDEHCDAQDPKLAHPDVTIRQLAHVQHQDDIVKATGVKQEDVLTWLPPGKGLKKKDAKPKLALKPASDDDADFLRVN